MPFVFLLLFALICFQTRWPGPPPWLDFVGSLLLPWVMAALFWLAAAAITHRFCRQLLHDRAESGTLWRQFQRLKRVHSYALIACYLAVLFSFGWGHTAKEVAGYLGGFPGAEVIQFAPFLLALVLSWSRFYVAERTFFERSHDADRFLGPWGYLAYHIRHNLLLVVPVIVLLLALRLFFLAFPGLEQHDTALSVIGVALLFVAVVSVPIILRVFLGLRPLAAGPLRERLDASARRLGFRFSNVLVWDTQDSVANAMVSGIVPWVRYVVLTDLLIERLTPDEVEAVFGHEVGHIKHHHMLLYIVFFLGSLMTLLALWNFAQTEGVQAGLRDHVPDLRSWSEAAEVAAGPILLGVVSVYTFIVFGFLSRRCERQADIFGCRTVSCDAFISALEKVADINGIPRRRTSWLASWQHPTIAERVEFCERLRDNPAIEPLFQRSLFVVKWGLMGAVMLGLVVVLGVLWHDDPNHVWNLFRMR